MQLKMPMNSQPHAKQSTSFEREYNLKYLGLIVPPQTGPVPVPKEGEALLKVIYAGE
jgi:hypothetical protein